MNTYHYDHIYPYEKMMQEVKELILPTIEDNVNPEDLQYFGLNATALSDIIYIHIMALGYNKGDLKAAFDDIFPTRSHILYPQLDETDAAGTMMLNLAAFSDEYKHQIWAFTAFHEGTQALKPYKEVMHVVKSHLLIFLI